jgi:hypothetical protein
MVNERLLKTISIFSFVLITVAIALIYNSQAAGYEASIYASTPILAWISLILSLGCGIYVAVSSLFSRGANNRFPILGVSIAAFSTVVILLVFALRGYYALNVRGDIGEHLSLVYYVLAHGSASQLDYYPLTHYYVAALYDFTGISIIDIFGYLPAFFEVLYMAAIFLLATTVLPRKEQAILATLAGIPLLHDFYLMLTPNALLVLVFPFVTYVILRSLDRRALSFTLLAVILVVFLAVLHPLGALTLAILLFGLWLFQRFKAPFKGSELSLKKFKIDQNLMVLSAITFFGWIIHFEAYGVTINNVLTQFNSNETYAARLATTADAAQAVGYNIYEQFLKLWTGTAIYLTLSLIAFVLVWRGLSRGKDLVRLKGLLGGTCLVVAVFMPFLFVNAIVSPFRILASVLTLSAVFVGFVLFEFNDWLVSFKKHGKTVGVVVACVLLIGVSVNGILYLYPSTFTLAGTIQTTHAEVDGNYWFLLNRIPDLGILGLYYAPYRFSYLLPAVNESTQPYLSPSSIQNVPWHLGYNNYTHMGEAVKNDTYVVFSEQSKRWYVDVYPELASVRIQPQDFSRMDNDTTLNKLYTNGGFDVWYLTAQPPP